MAFFSFPGNIVLSLHTLNVSGQLITYRGFRHLDVWWVGRRFLPECRSFRLSHDHMATPFERQWNPT